MGGDAITFNTSNSGETFSLTTPSNGKSYLVRELEKDRKDLADRFSFKSDPEGMGTSIKITTTSQKKVTMSAKTEPKEVQIKQMSAKAGQRIVQAEFPATKAQPMSSQPPRESSWSSPDDEVVYENEHVRKYRNPKTGKTYYEPKVKDLSPKERQAWLKAIERATAGFWKDANAELKNITDAEARREYEANKEKYDNVEPGDEVTDPIEKARRALAASRALKKHKTSN